MEPVTRGSLDGGRAACQPVGSQYRRVTWGRGDEPGYGMTVRLIAKVSTSFNWTGEVTVESDRFSDAPGLPAASDIRATAGAQWLFAKHHILRAALSAGLSDGAPSYELIGGYAYWF